MTGYYPPTLAGGNNVSFYNHKKCYVFYTPILSFPRKRGKELIENQWYARSLICFTYPELTLKKAKNVCAAGL